MDQQVQQSSSIPLRLHGRKAVPEPSFATLWRWQSTGIARATDGCRVEPDGTCMHGCPSWLIELGYI